MAQCETFDTTTCPSQLTLNTGYAGTQSMTRDASTSPNFVALTNQDFILNNEPICCGITACTFSTDSTGIFRVGTTDLYTLEVDVSKGHGALSDYITMTCTY